MSRQTRNQRERKTAEPKRDVVENNDRYLRTEREENRNQERDEIKNNSGLDKYTLNDLYERSSV